MASKYYEDDFDWTYPEDDRQQFEPIGDSGPGYKEEVSYKSEPPPRPSPGGGPEPPPSQVGGNFNPEEFLKGLESKYGTGSSARSSDLSQIQGKNPEDVPQFLQDLTAQYERRGAPTASAGGRGGDADLDYNGQIDPGWVKGSGGQYTFQGKGVAGKAPSGFNLGQLQGLGQQYAGPGSGGVFGNQNLQQVGQDPLSQLISGGYIKMLENAGQTPLGQDLDATLRGLLERKGGVDEDPQAKAARLEAARQPIEAMRKAQTSQAQGALMDRNLLSVPGIPQGAEINTLGRIEENLAPYYATAGQNLAAQDFQAQDERLSQALTLATGLSQAQAQAMLATLNSAGARQQMLSQIALETLDRNMTWNMFLAQFGLQRDQIMYAIEQGRYDQLMPILQMFAQFTQLLNNGYV